MMQNDNNSDYLDNDVSRTDNKPILNSTNELTEVEQMEAIKDMKTNFVFFFGKPSSGKSAILSSIIYCLRQGNIMSSSGEKIGGSLTVQNKLDDDSGIILENIIHEQMKKRRFVDRTTAGSITYLGIEYTPDKSKKLPSIDVTFLEMSGEDLKKVEVNRDGLGKLPSNIDVFFKATEISLLFILTAHWKEAAADDQRTANFLEYLIRQNPDLKKTRVILLISQWDKNPNKDKEGVNEFVKNKMKATYTLMEDSKNVVNEYSIGHVIELDKSPYIEKFNDIYPSQLWKFIYKSITGQDLDKKSFLDKLLEKIKI